MHRTYPDRRSARTAADEAVTPHAYGDVMDIAFTITVWILLVALVAQGLRMTQRAHAEASRSALAADPPPLLPDHPVLSTAPAPRELVGASS